MRMLVLFMASALMLAGCTNKDKRVYFDGKYYPAKAKKVKGDRESFVVNVRKASQGLPGAREAGRHAGTRYCVETFGYSEIDWQIGPDAEDAQLSTSKGNLVLRGRCKVWE
ncbi:MULTISPECIES: hypothetical protein [unclassified Roseovarius]|uniref:hypothetical protein n=1 Tax=unclassified Roseovarius TaxID=2614913 RepID=UPI00273D2AC0|nr:MULTISPECIES: hypothetical protein [unclassified Roseovarius]